MTSCQRWSTKIFRYAFIGCIPPQDHLKGENRYVGSPVKCKECPGLISGRTPYVDNMTPTKVLYVSLVRRPYVHARLKSLDVEAARIQGVVSILTGKDLKGDSTPLPYHITLPFPREASESTV
jgi:CO/xanthine dehydrogenase Mo-binding subunit